MKKKKIMVENGSNSRDASVPQSPKESLDNDYFFTPAVIRHNMKVMIFLEAIYATGEADMQLALNPLLAHLNAPYKIVGIIKGLTWASILGWILSPYITRHFPFKKWYYISTGIVSAMVFLVLGVGLLLSPSFISTPQSLTIFTFACFLVFYLLYGFVGLPHSEYLVNCLPANWRGRMFGMSLTIGSITTLGIISISGILLNKLEKPSSFGYCFIMTCLLWIIGYLFSARARERRSLVEKSPKPWTREMFSAFWSDRSYVRFLGVWIIIHLTISPINGLIPVYGLKELQMAAYTSAIIAGIENTVKIGGMTPCGILVDKFTPKRIFPWTLLFIGIGYLIVFLVPNHWGIYISKGVLVLTYSVFFNCATVLAISIPTPEHRASNITIMNITTMLIFAIGPMVAGWFSDMINFRYVCLAGAILAALYFPITTKIFRPLLSEKMY